MNRNALSRFIGGWILAAAPLALGGCPFAGGKCGAEAQVTVLIASDSGGAGDGGVAGCEVICLDATGGNVLSCGPTTTDAGAPAIDCHVRYLCTGRRPEALAASDWAPGQSEVAGYLARAAHLEAASVPAFEQLAEELGEHAAPAGLVARARRAARDEVRHARVMAALARRFGGTAAPAVVGPRRARPLEALALENAVEGCVRETFGAVTATWQARAAGDARVRAVMARIATDETRHAELALAIAGWVEPRLDDAARARVTNARRAAADGLAHELRGEPPAALAVLGLPGPAVAASLLASMRRDLAI